MKRVCRWTTRLGSMLCLVLLAQCSAPSPVPVRSAFERAVSPIVLDPRFQDGLDRLISTQPWPMSLQHPDMDWLLLGVRAQWNGQSRIWFVRVAEIVDPEEAEGGRRLKDRRFEYTVPFGVGAIRPGAKFVVPCRRLRIETYDANGEFVAAWSRLVPEVFPESSLFEGLASLPRPWPFDPNETWNPEDTSRVALGMTPGKLEHGDPQTHRDRGLYEMVAVLQALGMSPPVAPIRAVTAEHIVRVPSLVALLLSGLQPTATANMRVAAPIEYPGVLGQGAVACFQSEFTTTLAGEKCFECRVVAGPSLPPLHLLGGLLAIEAVNPTKPDNRLVVRVLATSQSSASQQ